MRPLKHETKEEKSSNCFQSHINSLVALLFHALVILRTLSIGKYQIISLQDTVRTYIIHIDATYLLSQLQINAI